MSDVHNIPQFLDYLGVRGPKDEAIDVIHYDDHRLHMRAQSAPVNIDFYSLAIKKHTNGPGATDGLSEFYIYLDTPNKSLEWDKCDDLTGYGIAISVKLLEPFVKQYSFATYKSQEALFLTPEEKTILLDLFEKAYTEYCKEPLSRPVLVSYAVLILSYIQLFYERQNQSRTHPLSPGSRGLL